MPFSMYQKSRIIKSFHVWPSFEMFPCCHETSLKVIVSQVSQQLYRYYWTLDTFAAFDVLFIYLFYLPDP